MDTVSIIIPFYNEYAHLKRAVSRVCEQTYSQLEVLLIDDGSDDGSGELAESLALADKRIGVYHLQHGGVSAARNYGIHMATGRYVQFVDADDYPEATMTEKLVEALTSSGLAMAACGYVKEQTNKSSEVLFEEEDVSSVCTTIQSNILSITWNKLYIRGNIDTYYEENLTRCEDSLFCMNYALTHPGIAIVGQCLYHYSVKPVRQTDAVKLKTAIRGLQECYLCNCRLLKSDTLQQPQTLRKTYLFICKNLFYSLYTYVFEAAVDSEIPFSEWVLLVTKAYDCQKIRLALTYLHKNEKELYLKELVYLHTFGAHDFYSLYICVKMRRGIKNLHFPVSD